MVEVEEWRDIAGYEGYYQVSNLGRVKCLARKTWNGKVYFNKREMIMKPNLMAIGYYCVTLTKDSIQTKRYIHRLVAEAFIPNPNGLGEVDHIDANPKNNNVNNLRWVTHHDNMMHIFELGHHYDGTANLHTPEARRKAAKKNSKTVLRSDGKIFESAKAAASYMGVSDNHISKVIRKRKWCRGFQFEYLCS